MAPLLHRAAIITGYTQGLPHRADSLSEQPLVSGCSESETDAETQ